MRATRRRHLAATAAVVGVVGFSVLGMWESRGGTGLPLPWLAVVALLVVAGGVLLVGRPVRRWSAGHRDRPLDPLRAARTVVLAKACAIAGAALSGWYAAQALLVAGDLAIEPRRERFVLAVLATLAALAMVVAGLVVEHWCRLPDDDEDDDGAGGVPPVGAAH